MLVLRRLDPNHCSNIENRPGSSNWNNPFHEINACKTVHIQYPLLFQTEIFFYMIANLPLQQIQGVLIKSATTLKLENLRNKSVVSIMIHQIYLYYVVN